MKMLILTIFLITATAGALLIYYIFNNKNTPKAVVIFHGIFAFIAITVLSIYAYLYHPKAALYAGLFLLVAIGGAYVAYRDISSKPIPKHIALMHGAMALIGIVALLLFL
jgi:hypothetical protein